MRIIAGKFRGKTLLSPSDDSIRPTSDRARESVFNILASRLSPNFDGLKVLDLHRPLATGEETTRWISETTTAAWTIYVLGPAGLTN